MITNYRDSVLAVQKKWQTEREEWRQGCDTLQSCNHIVQLQNVLEIEKERMNVLKEMEVTRIEKLQRLQRDFRITMFQSREIELEERVSELEAEREAVAVEYEGKICRLNDQNVQHIAQMRGKECERVAADQRLEDLTAKLNILQENNADLSTKNDSLNTKINRIAMQFECEKTKSTQFERKNLELSQANSDLQVQLEKWQDLETKGLTQADTHRKKCSKLETRVQNLVAELEGLKEEKETAIGNQKNKVEKLKERVAEWQAEAEKFEDECETSNKLLSKAQKDLIKVKGELDLERARVSTSPDKSYKSKVELCQQEVKDLNQRLATCEAHNVRLKAELEVERARLKDLSREKIIDLEAGEVVDTPASGSLSEQSVKKPVVKKRNKKPVKSREAVAEPSNSRDRGEKESGSGIEVGMITSPTKASAKGKSKAEMADVGNNARNSPPKRKRSKQVFSDVEIIDEVQPASNPTTRSRRTRGQQTLKGPDKEEKGKEDGIPKKKRKINVFPPNESSTFNFMQPTGDGLGIPTVLSPVKENGGVPSRSTSASVVGGIGGLLRSSIMTGRRR